MNNRSQISLSGTRNELTRINQDLQSKCGSSYKLELTQYRYRDVGSALYDPNSNEYDILLCLYHENKCISSITGRYIQSNNAMELLSKTDPKYEGLKFNLYLRSIFIYLMCFVRPSIKKIYSNATNPISTYAMYKHYHVTSPELDEYVKTHNLNPETFTLEHARSFHSYFNEKYKQTPESAQKELEDMLEDCSEDNGIKCTVEDLGWETIEHALEFIMTSINFTAITLELDLDRPGIKEFLLNKLLTTQIKCLSHSISGGKLRHNNKSKNNTNKNNKKRTSRPHSKRKHRNTKTCKNNG